MDPNNRYVEDDKGKNTQPSIVVDSGLKKRKREGEHWGFGGVESINCGCCGDKNWGSNFRCDQELELRRLRRRRGAKTGVQTSDVTKVGVEEAVKSKAGKNWDS